ncbi:TlpA family protein disulfide reductase [Jeotgalibacillus marinus]|uniref:TlpA disulfide reductase family protein n=1 Tax=Jeotgalibacillus marinus TaxID=86667 RepID=A0ABV3Q1C9_9BACL
MIKRILALILVVGLIITLIVNVVNDKQERQEELARQQEYAVMPSDNSSAQVVTSGGALKEGQAAPDFQTTTLDGSIVSLSDYRGKKIILNLWATWCGPCIEEMPHIQEYYEEEADKDNVEVLAVNLTNMDNGIDRVESFVEDYGLTFPILMDESGQLGDQFQAIAIPTTYILDEDGLITKKLMGPMDREMISSMMKE